jgi:uncharacterized protein YutE (UPF0331/DUF86 family)
MTVDTLNQVFSTYEIIKDSIKVTRRSIDKSVAILHSNTIFFGEQNDKIMKKISFVETELDDIMILALFASFERELRVSIQNVIDMNVRKNNPVIIKIIVLTSESVERWIIKDIIDAFDGIVDDDIRSKVKQIYDYRNWVAHGKNPDKPPPIKTDPKIVFLSLCDFAKQASSVL